jgi:hypothetical protein
MEPGIPTPDVTRAEVEKLNAQVLQVAPPVIDLQVHSSVGNTPGEARTATMGARRLGAGPRRGDNGLSCALPARVRT